MTGPGTPAGKNAAALRLAIILVAFPFVLVYAVPALPAVRDFYAGDRTRWFDFWLIAVGLEWLTLLAVLATVRHRRTRLEAIGFPVRLSRAQVITALAILAVTLALAVLGAGGPQEFLRQLPAGVRMFIPPSDAGARVFWVFVSLTAALCEETLWRGFAITEARALTGSTLLAVLVPALSFVFFHGGLHQGAVVFGYRFAVALVLSAIYLKAGSLKPVILIHFVMDASALAAIQVD